MGFCHLELVLLDVRALHHLVHLRVPRGRNVIGTKHKLGVVTGCGNWVERNSVLITNTNAGRRHKQ